MTWIHVPTKPFENPDDRPTHLSLFSGGGGELLFSQYIAKLRTVCCIEWEKSQWRILRKRQEEGYLQDCPIWDDISTFDGRPWHGLVDVFTAGFPCQPFSRVGPQLGATDPKNRWPDTIRLLRDIRPRIALLENVPALFSSDYLGRVFGDLAEAGYSYQWTDVPAMAVGAPHLRERLWIMAYPTGERCSLTTYVEQQENNWGRRYTNGNPWWKTEPQVGRVAHGLAHGMGRALAATGDGLVPAVAGRVWEMMVEDKRETR